MTSITMLGVYPYMRIYGCAEMDRVGLHFDDIGRVAQCHRGRSVRRVLSVAERAEDGVTVDADDADMRRALPAVAGRAFVGLVTASSAW